MPLKLKKIIFGSPYSLLAVIIAAALVMRTWIARLLPGYTFDEMVSAATAEKPLGQIWSYARFDMYPPLHAYGLHFWFDLFGSSETAGHSFSILLSVLAVAALYFLGRKVFNSNSAGLAAASFFALSPIFCFYGAWARMYAMLLLFSTLSFLFFLKLIESRGRPAVSAGIFYALFTLLALYSHLTAGLVIIIELAHLAYLGLRKNIAWREALKKFILPFVFLIITYGPWLIFFLTWRLGNLDAQAWYYTSSGNPQFVPWVVYDALKYLTPLAEYWPNLLAFSLLATLSFSALAAIRRKNGGWKIKGIFSTGHFFALAVFLLSFIFLFIAKLFVLRYAIIPAIGLFLILGYGFSVLRREIKIACAGVFFCLSILSFSTLFASPLINNWSGAADYILENEKPGDKIIASLYSSLLPLDRYYRGNLPVAAPLDEKYREGDLLRAVIRTNVYPTTDENNINQLENFLNGSQRIFLVITDGDGAFPGSGKITEDWLFARGFRKTGEWPGARDKSFMIQLMEKTSAR